MIRSKKVASTFATVSFLAVNQIGYSSGFGVRSQSTTSMGSGFSADGVNTNDPSGIFANPATVSFLKGSQVGLGMTYVRPFVDFTEGKSTTATFGQDVSGEPKVSEVGGVSTPGVAPSMSAAYHIDDVYSFGISANVPWATNSDYPENWVGRYHGEDTNIRSYNISPVFAAKLTRNLSIATGIQYQHLEGDLTAAVDLGTQAFAASGFKPQLQLLAGRNDAGVRFQADGVGYGFLLGTVFQSNPLTVGLGYRSQIRHELEGDVQFTGRTDFANQALSAQSTNGGASTTITTPDVYSLGIAYQVNPDLKLLHSTSLTRWSVFKTLDIKFAEGGGSKTRQNWKDSYFSSVGADYKVFPSWSLRSGVAYEQSAVRDNDRTPRTPDSDRTVFALGYGGLLQDNIQIDVAYNYYIMSESKIQLKADAYPDNNGRGNLEGKLGGTAHAVMLQSVVKI